MTDDLSRPEHLRQHAKHLYWQGWGIPQIGKKYNLNPSTLHSWKRRDLWDGTEESQKIDACICERICQLLLKLEKTENELREIDVLMKARERSARIKRYEVGVGNQTDLNPKTKRRNNMKRKKEPKNFLSEEQIEALIEDFESNLFDYQRTWHEAGKVHDIRNILKSRQIGATWYFAREAFVQALRTGNNQIFLSASKAQAFVFKLYIIQWVLEITGVELKGDPMVLGHNNATLYFLGTNANTAQSYHGDLYTDEYFWIQRFKKFQEVSSGMAMHEKWRETYFSTPSSTAHEAYSFWTGDHFNQGRPKTEHIKLDVSHSALKDGRLCEDGQWRQMVTVEDAVAGGCTLFDIEKLRRKYSPDAFNNLLMCHFIDDKNSIFTVAQLTKCMVDAMDKWDDFKPYAPRPFGNKPVWVGYDPSRVHDAAEVVVMAPPTTEYPKFRVLEKLTFYDMRWELQAKEIEKITKRYNVEYLGMDMTSIGSGVHELVSKFYPAVDGFTYSPDVKRELVLKAQSVIASGRFEYDYQHKDIAVAFLTVHKTVTASGNAVTYQSTRTEEAGHGDAAWACMHAFHNEPLSVVDSEDSESGGSFVEIC